MPRLNSGAAVGKRAGSVWVIETYNVVMDEWQLPTTLVGDEHLKMRATCTFDTKAKAEKGIAMHPLHASRWQYRVTEYRAVPKKVKRG